MYDIKGNTLTICKDCEYIPAHVKCQYCLDPEEGVAKIQSGLRFPLFNYKCISCQCSSIGSVQCDYNNTRQCDDQQSCRKYFKQLKNGTFPYQCKDCVFDGRKKRIYSIWKVTVNGKKNQVECTCQVNGEIDCDIETRIGEFRFQIKGNKCSTTKIIEEKFKHKGLSLFLDIEYFYS